MLSSTKFLLPDFLHLPIEMTNPTETTRPTKCGDCGECVVGKSHPARWGPSAWHFLHTSAAFYPTHPSKAQQEAMIRFIKSLPIALPCQKCTHECSEFIRKNLDQLPFICSSNDRLFNFYVDLHNAVNRRYGKVPMSYEDARRIYYDRLNM